MPKKKSLPGIEFEGPMGRFWSMKEVPIKALFLGLSELFWELLKRPFRILRKEN